MASTGKIENKKRKLHPGGAGSGVWTRGSMIAREKKSGRVRLSTNALKINMENVPSIVVIENLSWCSSVNRLLLLFLLALVNLDLLWRKSQTSWMESKRLVEEFNRRKHMFTFDGEFTESFLLPGPGIMISKLVIGAFRTNVLHREDVLTDII